MARSGLEEELELELLEFEFKLVVVVVVVELFVGPVGRLVFSLFVGENGRWWRWWRGWGERVMLVE